jgi:hypothetical protein
VRFQVLMTANIKTTASCDMGPLVSLAYRRHIPLRCHHQRTYCLSKSHSISLRKHFQKGKNHCVYIMITVIDVFAFDFAFSVQFPGGILQFMFKPVRSKCSEAWPASCPMTARSDFPWSKVTKWGRPFASNFNVNILSFTSTPPIDLHDVVLKHRSKNTGVPKPCDFKPSDVDILTPRSRSSSEYFRTQSIPQTEDHTSPLQT